MRKLTILIDMDDTLENLCEVWVNQLSALFGVGVTVDDIHQWDMTKAFPMLNKQEIYWPLRSEALWENVKPLPGAVEAVKNLKADGHRVVIVTAATADSAGPKLKRCLFKYFPVKMEDVIIANQKGLIQGDVMIDDGPHNLLEFSGERVLFTAPHNRLYNEQKDNMTRVNNWTEAYEYIQELAGRE